MNNLKVIIVGSGIGGLTAGIALRQAGYEIEIYDRVRELRPGGAGISLWSNGVKVLNRLGLGSKMAAIGGLMNRMQYRRHTGELLNDIDLAPLIEEVGQRPYPVARADLQQMLLEAYGEDVRLECKCVGVHQDATGVTAYFENGHTARGDLLVAADGVRSILRQYVLEEKVEPDYVGYVNWNGLVPVDPELAPKDMWMIYVGEHKRVSLMPVGGDRFYFFFDVPMTKEDAQQAGDIRTDLTVFFTGWADPVQTLIQRLDPEKTNRVLIHSVGPLSRMVRGRIALLGDAAHTTCPDLGQGGCQALEDALVLTHYLMTTNLGIEYALKRYERERMERANPVVEKARRRAEQIHGKDPNVTQQWYDQLASEKPTDVTGAIAKIILAGPMR
ncbi:FAD-dependent urate hydroxylase HpxO [Leptothermofonsia sp. ETS-13]|uniref:FAD-dependent urate hydroxylase HpxO n=1 Tax=Leptothermofonsia sp. ETS-13 TaxID=3035696 RepID=UPI003B9FF859